MSGVKRIFNIFLILGFHRKHDPDLQETLSERRGFRTMVMKRREYKDLDTLAMKGSNLKETLIFGLTCACHLTVKLKSKKEENC